jgi:L-glyceraldehyde 3-phosphate reductase
VGVSNYPPQMLREASALLRQMGTPCLIHQPRYNLFDRQIEGVLLDALREEGVGCIAFSPLAQGLLTDKYLGGIPADSRAAKSVGFLTPKDVTPERLTTITRLNDIAAARGQKLSQMALSWVLRHPGMTSVLIGASRISQIDDAVGAVHKLGFNDGQHAAIEQALRG